MNIQEQIKKDRPTLKDNSINAYVTVIRKLNSTCHNFYYLKIDKVRISPHIIYKFKLL